MKRNTLHDVVPASASVAPIPGSRRLVRRAARILLIAGAFGSAAALAQQDRSVDEARAVVAGLGKQWNGQVNTATRAAYVKLQQQVDPGQIKQISDLSYGAHELQKIDLFYTEGSSEPGPVVIYFHGGGLTGGDKVGPDGLIYSNIMRFIARMGGVGVNANYRLVPEVRFPAGAEDMHMVLEWVQEHIADYGGDPGAVFLMGNSAGSRHVATYLFHEASQFDDGPRIVGAMLGSGSYTASHNDSGRAYYGDNAADREAHAPLGLLESYEGEVVPMFLWSAEYDPISIEGGVAEMYAALCRKYQDCPAYTQFQGHNHVSHVMSIDSKDTEVADAVARFMHSVLDDK
jgi:acetyl esterase/lipase